MSQNLPQNVSSWLGVSQIDDGIYTMTFSELHIGNPIIRSLHGGVVGTFMEFACERFLENYLAKDGISQEIEMTSSAIDYVRVTKDADLFARPKVVRIARRVAFIDVCCWQDKEDIIVAKSSCTFRILSK